MYKWDVQRDERVLWEGKPQSGFVCRPEQVASMLVGVAMIAVAVWLLMALLHNGLEPGGLLLSLVIVSVGIYLAIGVVLIDITYRRGVRYAVTDHRILIRSEPLSDDISSIALLKTNGKPLGISVTFDRCITLGTPPLLGHAVRFWGPLYRLVVEDPRLECLENPASVYRIIRTAQRRITGRPKRPDLATI